MTLSEEYLMQILVTLKLLIIISLVGLLLLAVRVWIASDSYGVLNSIKKNTDKDDSCCPTCENKKE